MIRSLRVAALAALALAPLAAKAELVWTPETGWEVRGGVLDASAKTPPPADPVQVTALDLMNKARAAQNESRWYTALTYYNEVIDGFPGTEFEAEALYQKGVIHLRRSQFERAFNDFDAIRARHPGYPHFARVIEGEFAVAMAIRRGERPYLWGWIPWFKDNEKALDFFSKVQAAAPRGPLADWALFQKGEWGRELDKEDEAIDGYERLVYDYPDSVLTPKGYIAMAELYAGRVMGPHWDQGSTREALNFYRDFVELFPRDPYAPKAQERVVELRETLARNRLELGKFYYERRNNGRAAAIFLNEAVNAAPDSATAREAQALLAKVRAAEPPPLTLLDRLFGRYPKSDAGDFVDAQSQQNLETMGFRAARRDEISGETEPPAAVGAAQ